MQSMTLFQHTPLGTIYGITVLMTKKKKKKCTMKKKGTLAQVEATHSWTCRVNKTGATGLIKKGCENFSPLIIFQC